MLGADSSVDSLLTCANKSNKILLIEVVYPVEKCYNTGQYNLKEPMKCLLGFSGGKMAHKVWLIFKVLRINST
jgi:hypothetical protein